MEQDAGEAPVETLVTTTMMMIMVVMVVVVVVVVMMMITTIRMLTTTCSVVKCTNWSFRHTACCSAPVRRDRGSCCRSCTCRQQRQRVHDGGRKCGGNVNRCVRGSYSTRRCRGEGGGYRLCIWWLYAWSDHKSHTSHVTRHTSLSTPNTPPACCMLSSYN